MSDRKSARDTATVARYRYEQRCARALAEAALEANDGSVRSAVGSLAMALGFVLTAEDGTNHPPPDKALASAFKLAADAYAAATKVKA